MFNLDLQSFVIWLVILISIAIVCGLTYLYSKNKRYTFIAMLLSIYIITLIIIVASLSDLLTHQFIGRLDQLGVPYIYAKTGWSQLIYAWSIWILPVMLSSLLMIFITALFTNRSKAVVTSIEQKTSSANEPSTSFTQMTERLGKDALKNTLSDSVEKLSEALVSITAQEHKIAELTAQLHKSSDHITEDKKHLEDQISLLQLQLNALTSENEQLTSKLENCKSELELSHQMFNKLLEYKQNDEGSSES